jgi:hypothetical protein
MARIHYDTNTKFRLLSSASSYYTAHLLANKFGQFIPAAETAEMNCLIIKR